MSAKEKLILQALNSPITVNFRNSKLEDVIEYLQTYTGQAILLDREGMKDAEISYDTGITLNVKGVTVRTVLRKILGDLGMTYVIKDETIQATSAQKAREMMVVRRYYVGDLLANMGGLEPFGSPQAGFWNRGIQPGALQNFGGFPFAPVSNQLQAMKKMESVKQLMELVQSSVDPQTWQGSGGNGTITFHAPSMSLIIKQERRGAWDVRNHRPAPMRQTGREKLKADQPAGGSIRLLARKRDRRRSEDTRGNLLQSKPRQGGWPGRGCGSGHQ